MGKVWDRVMNECAAVWVWCISEVEVGLLGITKEGEGYGVECGGGLRC